MSRYRLTLEFDGAPFVGWQRQASGLSVQEALEEAAFKVTGERPTAFAAGRTDAGVHAIAMPAHLDLEKAITAFRLQEALNFHLRPAPIAVIDAAIAAPDFHARFSARARRYLYRIVNRRAPLALEAGRAWRIAPPVDADAMHVAAQSLIGKHDFSTFRASQCQAASPVKTLTSIAVSRRADAIEIETTAPSFLHHQVRSMVGSLVEVGLGRWTERDFKSAFEARDRARCGQVAPPDGLYFLRADYD